MYVKFQFSIALTSIDRKCSNNRRHTLHGKWIRNFTVVKLTSSGCYNRKNIVVVFYNSRLVFRTTKIRKQRLSL